MRINLLDHLPYLSHTTGAACGGGISKDTFCAAPSCGFNFVTGLLSFFFKDKNKSQLFSRALNIIIDISISLQDHQLKGRGDILSSKLPGNLLDANHKTGIFQKANTILDTSQI